MAQLVKDLTSSLQWLRLLLWHRLDPWHRNLHMSRAWPKKKKKKRCAETSLALDFKKGAVRMVSPP